MTQRLFGVLAILLALASTAPAFAQSCSFSYTPLGATIDFGNIDVTDNTVFQTTIALNVTCTGSNNQRVRVCPSIGTGTGGAISTTRYLVNGANQMTFNIYQGGFGTIWGSYFWGFAPRPPTINLRLSSAGTGTASETLYAQIDLGQTNLPAGTYTSNFIGGHTAYAYADRSVGNCNAIGAMNATQVPFAVTATNVASCDVTASDLNFGTVSNLSGNLDVDGSATVTCTNLWPYRVLLDDGLTGTSPTNRKMTLGANSVTYGLYRDAARTLAWGNTSGVNSLSGTGTGAVQSLTIYGRVPAQAMPPPGTYSDTIVVTVEY